nr:hypothetical protein 11 [Desulfobulbaceae bacterium]
MMNILPIGNARFEYDIERHAVELHGYNEMGEERTVYVGSPSDVREYCRVLFTGEHRQNEHDPRVYAGGGNISALYSDMTGSYVEDLTKRYRGRLSFLRFGSPSDLPIIRQELIRWCEAMNRMQNARLGVH